MFLSKNFFLLMLVAMMWGNFLSLSASSFAVYKKHAKEYECIFEPRTLALCAATGVGLSVFNAYRSMKKGFFEQEFDRQKKALDGHEDLLQSVREKLIALVQINPENKADVEELKAEEALLIEEIKKIKETHKEWSFGEISKSQAFKYISLSDVAKGCGPVLGGMILAQLGFKGYQLALRATDYKTKDAYHPDALWESAYTAQGDFYSAFFDKALIVAKAVGVALAVPIGIVVAFPPEKRGFLLGCGLTTCYALKDLVDEMQLRKSASTEKFSYVDDLLMDPQNIFKEMGPGGVAKWGVSSYLLAKGISILFGIADKRKELNAKKSDEVK